MFRLITIMYFAVISQSIEIRPLSNLNLGVTSKVHFTDTLPFRKLLLNNSKHVVSILKLLAVSTIERHWFTLEASTLNSVLTSLLSEGILIFNPQICPKRPSGVP